MYIYNTYIHTYIFNSKIDFCLYLIKINKFPMHKLQNKMLKNMANRENIIKATTNELFIKLKFSN